MKRSMSRILYFLLVLLVALATGCSHAPATPQARISTDSGVSSMNPTMLNEKRANDQGKLILSYEQLMTFEYDCARREEQINLLEDQIKYRTFYKVDGVEGSEAPGRINKKYYSLLRYRIWSLRLGCKGSSVDKRTQLNLKDAHPVKPPEPVQRCYFEEHTVSTLSFNSAEELGDNLVRRRKEFCTNYPIAAESKDVQVGDLVDPKRYLDKSIPYIPNLRKWHGNVFQMISISEVHHKEVIKFTVVLMWSGSAWVAVDKF